MCCPSNLLGRQLGDEDTGSNPVLGILWRSFLAYFLISLVAVLVVVSGRPAMMNESRGWGGVLSASYGKFLAFVPLQEKLYEMLCYT